MSSSTPSYRSETICWRSAIRRADLAFTLRSSLFRAPVWQLHTALPATTPLRWEGSQSAAVTIRSDIPIRARVGKSAAKCHADTQVPASDCPPMSKLHASGRDPDGPECHSAAVEPTLDADRRPLDACVHGADVCQLRPGRQRSYAGPEHRNHVGTAARVADLAAVRPVGRSGGEGGIRTHEGREAPPVFKSHTSPSHRFLAPTSTRIIGTRQRKDRPIFVGNPTAVPIKCR